MAGWGTWLAGAAKTAVTEVKSFGQDYLDSVTSIDDEIAEVEATVKRNKEQEDETQQQQAKQGAERNPAPPAATVTTSREQQPQQQQPQQQAQAQGGWGEWDDKDEPATSTGWEVKKKPAATKKPLLKKKKSVEAAPAAVVVAEPAPTHVDPVPSHQQQQQDEEEKAPVVVEREVVPVTTPSSSELLMKKRTSPVAAGGPAFSGKLGTAGKKKGLGLGGSGSSGKARLGGSKQGSSDSVTTPTTQNPPEETKAGSQQPEQEEGGFGAPGGLLGLGLGGLASVVTQGADLVLHVLPDLADESPQPKEEQQGEAKEGQGEGSAMKPPVQSGSSAASPPPNLDEATMAENAEEEVAVLTDIVSPRTPTQEPLAKAQSRAPAEPPLDRLRAARGRLQLNRKEDAQGFPTPNADDVATLEEILDPLQLSEFDFDDTEVAESVAWVGATVLGKRLASVRHLALVGSLNDEEGEPLTPDQLVLGTRMEQLPKDAAQAANQIADVLMEELHLAFVETPAANCEEWFKHGQAANSTSAEQSVRVAMAKNTIAVVTFALCEMAEGSKQLSDAVQECWMWAKRTEQPKDKIKSIKERSLAARGECYVASTDAVALLEEALECIIILFPFEATASTVSATTEVTGGTSKTEIDIPPSSPQPNHKGLSVFAPPSTPSRCPTGLDSHPTNAQEVSLQTPPKSPASIGHGLPPTGGSLVLPPRGPPSQPKALGAPMKMEISEDASLSNTGNVTPMSIFSPAHRPGVPPSTPSNSRPLEELGDADIARYERRSVGSNEGSSNSSMAGATWGAGALPPVTPPSTPSMAKQDIQKEVLDPKTVEAPLSLHRDTMTSPLSMKPEAPPSTPSTAQPLQALAEEDIERLERQNEVSTSNSTTATTTSNASPRSTKMSSSNNSMAGANWGASPLAGMGPVVPPSTPSNQTQHKYQAPTGTGSSERLLPEALASPPAEAAILVPAILVPHSPPQEGGHPGVSLLAPPSTPSTTQPLRQLNEEEISRMEQQSMSISASPMAQSAVLPVVPPSTPHLKGPGISPHSNSGGESGMEMSCSLKSPRRRGSDPPRERRDTLVPTSGEDLFDVAPVPKKEEEEDGNEDAGDRKRRGSH